MSTGIDLIAKERQRQIDKEGWTKEHDSQHRIGVLAMAGASYALPELWRQNISSGINKPPFCWPFSENWWKPSPNDRVKELVKAGALIAAEIDKLLYEQERGTN